MPLRAIWPFGSRSLRPRSRAVLFLLRTLTLESLAEVLPALSAHPLPTYLGGENQRTCGNGLIWNIADGARPNPEGLSRSFRVDIDSMVG